MVFPLPSAGLAFQVWVTVSKNRAAKLWEVSETTTISRNRAAKLWKVSKRRQYRGIGPRSSGKYRKRLQYRGRLMSHSQFHCIEAYTGDMHGDGDGPEKA